MTTPQKIEYIKQQCIKANNSILDLVMGCVVRDSLGLATLNKTYIPTTNEGIYESTNNKGNTVLAQIFEILGRDIQLADVLLAIEKKNDLPHLENKLVFFGNSKNEILGVIGIWNLLLPLHLQSESTIEFLYGILIDKEN